MIQLRIRKRVTLCLLLLTYLFLVNQGSYAQTTVRGKVFDQDGYPLIGVNLIQNGEVKASTGPDGTFSIELDQDSPLQFSHPEFKIQEEKWFGNAEMVIKMKKDPLRQKVNIAYGKQEMSNLTSSISTVSGEDLAKIPVQTLSNALQGMMPGLTVIQTSGEPGSDKPDIYIRGLKTYNDNSILIFVDGFESKIDHLLASEIESVTILKDAASLAPFGIRGANGVLLVTTKRGFEGKTMISFQSRVGFSQPIKLPDFLGSADYATLYNEALSNDAGEWSPVYSVDDINAYRNGTDPLFYPNINWYNEILQKLIPYGESNLSFRGGSKLVKYNVMLGYLSTDKLYKENQYDKTGVLNKTGSMNRYNLRSNFDAQLGNIFDMSLDLSGAIQNLFSPNIDNIWDILSNYPPNIYQPINPDGSWGGNAIYPDNPLGSIYAKGLKSTQDITFQTSYTLHENLDFITEGLKFSQSISFMSWFLGSYDRKMDYARYEPYMDVDTLKYRQFGNDVDFSVDESLYKQWRRFNLAADITYEREFGLNGISALFTYRQDQYIIGGNEVPYVNMGVAGRINYNYNKKYFAEFAFGYNGSENFPQGKRYGFFPAVSAGWMLSNESFMKNMDWINIFKIRASAGFVGNDRYGAGRFLYQQYYPNGNNYVLGWDGIRNVSTLVEGVVANPNITWESSFQYNIGFDSRFLNNKLDFVFDFFNEKRTGILSQRGSTVPLIVGIELPYENIGKVTNTGFELTLLYSDEIGNLEYNLGGNMSLARNKIEFMDEVVRREDYLYRTGNPIGQPFGLESIGFYQSWDEINDVNTPISVFGAVQPGDIRYKDQNSDGLINEDDEIPIGKSNIPELTYSFNAGLKWKGVDFSIFFYGVGGRSVYLDGDYVWAFQNNGQAPAIAEGRWSYYPAEGIDTRATATYPRLSTQFNGNNYHTSTFWQKNGNYLRLRNIELGYTLPDKIGEKVHMQGLRIYLSGTNLLTLDNLDGFDPEVMTGYPIFKSYNIGLNLNF